MLTIVYIVGAVVLAGAALKVARAALRVVLLAAVTLLILLLADQQGWIPGDILHGAQTPAAGVQQTLLAG